MWSVERCAGLDVHRDNVVATVRVPAQGVAESSNTRIGRGVLVHHHAARGNGPGAPSGRDHPARTQGRSERRRRGDDLISGGPGHDRLSGGPGRDRLIDGGGATTPSANNAEFWQFRLGATGAPETTAKYSQVPGPSSALAAADFDRRSGDDLAITSARTNGVSIHRSMTSSGVFVPQLDADNKPDAYATGSRPIAVATGQLDVADSPPDVATANVGDGTVTTWRNARNGNLRDRADAKVGDNPRALVIGRFAGDSAFRDVAVAVAGDDRVVVLERRGRQLNKVASVEAGDAPSELVQGDFDEDHRQDLMVANPRGQLTLLVGEAGGGFEPAKRVLDGPSVSAVARADFDRDNRTDLALTNPTEGTVTVLLGKGDGTFSPGLAYATGDRPAAVAAGDITGDGRPGLAVANLGSTTVTALLNGP